MQSLKKLVTRGDCGIGDDGITGLVFINNLIIHPLRKNGIYFAQ